MLDNSQVPNKNSTRPKPNVRTEFKFTASAVITLIFSLSLALHYQSIQRGILYKNGYKSTFDSIKVERQLLEQELLELQLQKAIIVENIGAQSANEAAELFVELNQLESVENGFTNEIASIRLKAAQFGNQFRADVNGSRLQILGVELGPKISNPKNDANANAF